MASPLYRTIIRVLKDHGCAFVKQGKGDHEIWESPISRRKFTVDTGIKSRHTANNIMRDAGINHKF